jgi:hypothetical protein
MSPCLNHRCLERQFKCRDNDGTPAAARSKIYNPVFFDDREAYCFERFVLRDVTVLNEVEV